jgi:hypothetical protein
MLHLQLNVKYLSLNIYVKARCDRRIHVRWVSRANAGMRIIRSLFADLTDAVPTN